MGSNKYKYFSKRDRIYAPTNEAQRRQNSEIIGSYTDKMLREKNKKAPEKGSRALFIEEYNKNGYEAAKKIIIDKFGKDIFSDEIFEKWRVEASKIRNRNVDDDAR